VDMGNVEKHSHVPATLIGLIQKRTSVNINNMGKTLFTSSGLKKHEQSHIRE
jgi:hypothetical protein